jgi:hypothetical protein
LPAVRRYYPLYSPSHTVLPRPRPLTVRAIESRQSGPRAVRWAHGNEREGARRSSFSKASSTDRRDSTEERLSPESWSSYIYHILVSLINRVKLSKTETHGVASQIKLASGIMLPSGSLLPTVFKLFICALSENQLLSLLTLNQNKYFPTLSHASLLSNLCCFSVTHHTWLYYA